MSIQNIQDNIVWENSNRQQVTTAQLLEAYAELDANIHSNGDIFFQRFGPGNMVSLIDPLMHIVDKPYERLAVYEHIIQKLHAADKDKYAQMHKGTVFFFISWLAFTVKDFEKAIFYMDSATAEDIRAHAGSSTPNVWQTTPAARFLLLDPNQPDMVARSIMNKITSEFEEQLERFNTLSGATLSITQYRDDFVIPNMESNSFRSIISGLYVFIMEFVDRMDMIRLKSIQGGSIEPFLVHLFKGCLIFESLLKIKYGGSGSTLGGYLASGLADLEIGQSGVNPVYRRDQNGGYTLPEVLRLLPTWRSESYSEKIIAISYGLRNTAGHDLSWPVIFDEATYQEIYEGIVDSIFWFIWKTQI